MNKALAVLSGLGFGAGLSYFADPERGKRRRALLRDKAIHVSRVSRDGLDVARRDLGNRASGWVAETSNRLRAEPVDDAVLVARVRATLGRHCAHPHAVEVAAQEGRVVLAGPIGAGEAGAVLDAIRRVPGVAAIEDRLVRQEGTESPGEGRELSAAERRLRQQYWSPAYRLVVGVSGGSLVLWGLARRGLVGTGLGLLGAGLLGRAIANQELRGLMGIGTEGQGFTVQKTLSVDAPIDRVYAFWSRPENFPRFMRHIREVRNLGEGRSHWVVSGPAGIAVEWEAEMTRAIPNRLIGWRSVPGSTVRHEGTIHLQENPDGSTRLHIQLCYHPPVGVVGHAVATVFGTDPKQSMDDDLARMKLLIQQEGATAPEPPLSSLEEGSRRKQVKLGPHGV